MQYQFAEIKFYIITSGHSQVLYNHHICRELGHFGRPLIWFCPCFLSFKIKITYWIFHLFNSCTYFLDFRMMQLCNSEASCFVWLNDFVVSTPKINKELKKCVGKSFCKGFAMLINSIYLSFLSYIFRTFHIILIIEIFYLWGKKNMHHFYQKNKTSICVFIKLVQLLWMSFFII